MNYNSGLVNGANPNQDSPYNEHGPKCEHGEAGKCVDCLDEGEVITFPLLSPPIKSCFEVQSERENGLIKDVG